jgi:hypothetical protein
MDFAIVYLLQRFCYRFFDFFRHWYGDGSRAIGAAFMGALTNADRSFAVLITVRHFFEPLYKDYTVVGRIVGVVFRSFRILIGVFVYLFIAVLFAIVYLVWISIPAVILYYAAKNI